MEEHYTGCQHSTTFVLNDWPYACFYFCSHLLRFDWEIHCRLCGIALKTKPFSAFCVYPLTFFVTAWPKCNSLIQNSEWNLWKFTRKLSNCEAPSLTNFLVDTLNKIITHYRWLTTLLIMNILFAHFWTFYTNVLQVPCSLHLNCKPCTIHNGFLQHSCF
jgi:hypothetical protein